MSDNMYRVLNSPDKGISRTSGINGILARLFRKILFNLRVGGKEWSSLMFDYLNDPKNMLPNNRKDQTSIRGNIAKEISRPQMTWKVFCKGLRILQVAEFELKIVITRRNGETSEHGAFVKLGPTQAEIEVTALPSELEGTDFAVKRMIKEPTNENQLSQHLRPPYQGPLDEARRQLWNRLGIGASGIDHTAFLPTAQHPAAPTGSPTRTPADQQPPPLAD